MKRVFSSQDMVINRWIDQSQDSARTSNFRISFKGDYIYSRHYSRGDQIIGKRLKDDLFLVSRYRSNNNGHKLYGVILGLRKSSKRFYLIKSFEDQNENVEDYKKLIKRKRNSIMRSTMNLSWRVDQFKSIVREYNRYIDEFNLRLTKLDENSMDDKANIRKVTLRLRGKKFY